MKISQSTIISDISQDLTLLDSKAGQESSERRKKISNDKTINKSDKYLKQIYINIIKSNPLQTINTSILVSYPNFKEISILNNLRKTEYTYLDKQNYVYLNYTNAGLAARIQYWAYQNRIAKTLFGNLYSNNPISQTIIKLIKSIRRRVL